MEITDKWLGEIGGWQAMKAARALIASGAVDLTEKSPDLVRGFVGQGKNRVSSGLRVRSRTDVDNLCTCLTARRDGRICEHALAVALASLALPAAPHPKPATSLNGPKAMTPSASVAISAPGILSLYLPETLLALTQDTNRPETQAKRGQLNRSVQLDSTSRSHTAFLKLQSGKPETSEFASWLAARQVPWQSMPLHLPVTEWPGLFKALVDHPRIFVGKPGAGQTNSLHVTDLDIRPLLAISQACPNQSDAVTLSLSEKQKPQLLTCAIETGKETCWLYHPSEGSLHPWRLPINLEVQRFVTGLMSSKSGEGETKSRRWLATHLADLENRFQIDWQKSLRERIQIVPLSAEYTIHLTGNERDVRIEVWAEFQTAKWRIGTCSDRFPIEDQYDNHVFYVQNVDQEKRVQDRITRLGLVQSQEDRALFFLRGEREVTRFFASCLPVLESEFRVISDDAWLRVTANWQRITPKLSINTPSASGHSIDWLNANLNYQASDGFHLSRNETLRLIRTGHVSLHKSKYKRYIIDVDRCEELEESLRDVSLQLTADGVRMQARHAAYFQSFTDRDSFDQSRHEGFDEDTLKAGLAELGEIMRPYQLEGVAWLIQRLRAGQGALLADDMGLGKTLQSIATVVWQLRQAATPRPQALVVCPKSLIPNWQAEFKRFAPDLSVLALQGNQREALFQIKQDFDVLITSYQLVVKDLGQLNSSQFEIMVLDEASFIRNPDTETSKAVKSLHYRNAIALSGTPIENGVRDLWSIYQVLLPGYLGERQQFQERFEKPLQAINSAAAVAAVNRLQRLIRPYFLRRTKSEVLKELPEKIEQILWCEPSAAQVEIYRRVLEEGREEIRIAKRRSGQNGARMTMLTVLLRLRQICCDLRLAGLSETVTESLTLDQLSGKWPVFQEALNEATSSGGKSLIFSQFVSYLQHCRDILEGLNIGYSYLDGSTTDRQASVESFQSDPMKQAFLISLKAGGYGLNLTQADRVFLLDPWWNPAVESQAIDRAHRFGQTRAVNAYRLILRGTVEERILELQQKKRGLIAAAMEDRTPMMQGLQDDDLESLLAP